MPKYKNIARQSHFKKDSKINELVIQKSKPLQLLAQTDITLAEFKILDVYLSKIDSRKPENRMVVFPKGEIEKLLGVKRIHKKELEKRMDNLFQTIHIVDPKFPQNINIISLFEQSIAEPDWDGDWIVKLKCTPAAMKYIFNIERLGYVRYSLHTILSLTSRYSYFLFLYLENNKFREKWKVSLKELKQIIGCTEKTYDKYYLFNTQILKKAQKELKEKAGIYFSYTGIKVGRSTKIIEFKINKLPKELEKLKDCEKNQNELTISENKDCTNSIIDDFDVIGEQYEEDYFESLNYTESNIENEVEEINEVVEPEVGKTKKRKSLADLKIKYEKVMQEDPFLTEVKEQFGYCELIQKNPKYTDVLGFIFQILCDTLGTDDDTIKIKGVCKSVDIVIPKLLKLKPEEILYVAKKYSELEDVQNPESYVLTMLYGVVGMPVAKKQKTSYNLNDLLAKSGLYIE